MSEQLKQLSVYKEKACNALYFVNSRIKRFGWINIAFIGVVGYIASEQWRAKRSLPIYFDITLLSRKKPTRTVYEDLYALKKK